jgi:hypothetical protein
MAGEAGEGFSLFCGDQSDAHALFRGQTSGAITTKRSTNSLTIETDALDEVTDMRQLLWCVAFCWLAACSSGAGSDVVADVKGRGADAQASDLTRASNDMVDAISPGEVATDWFEQVSLADLPGDAANVQEVAEETVADVPPETVQEVVDAIPDTAGSDVIEPADTVPETVEEIVPEEILLGYITKPDANIKVPEGSPVAFEGFVEDTLYGPELLTVTFKSDLAGELWSGTPEADGTTAFTTDALGPGEHKVTLTVSSPSGKSATDSVKVGICTTGEPETFDAPLTGAPWKSYGDAFWDPGGWLDMTGNVGDKQGAIFDITNKINPGDVTISFKIQTGPNVGNGADGFAMTVYDAEDATELEALIDVAHGGGGLGYGVSGPYGPAVVDALHVEVDTWHNQWNGNTELHTDPTTENHIAVCMNGNPGDCPLWTAVPNIEDMNWHNITIKIVGYHITVTLDGNPVMDEDVPGFEFRGGYIGFTGSTGYYSNYHRFDDLHVVQGCMVP